MSGGNFSEFRVTLTDNDKKQMESYFRLADMVADLIGPHSEVILHSFENLDCSVVKIVNGHHTGRSINSPITDMGLKMLRRFKETQEVNSKSYFTKNAKGELLKSTTCVVSGENGRAIGLFCININLSVPFPEIIKTLMPDMPISLMSSTETFVSNARDGIEYALDNAITTVTNDSNIGTKVHKKMIVSILYQGGIFELKEATAIISERLGISRHAIYKYLREFKTHSE